MRNGPFKDQMISHKRRYYNENRKQYAPRTSYLKRTVGTLRGPGGRWFLKKKSLGDRSNWVQWPPSAAARGGEAWRRNVWSPAYIIRSLQLSLTLSCIKQLCPCHGIHVQIRNKIKRARSIFSPLFVGKLYLGGLEKWWSVVQTFIERNPPHGGVSYFDKLE